MVGVSYSLESLRKTDAEVCGAVGMASQEHLNVRALKPHKIDVPSMLV